MGQAAPRLGWDVQGAAAIEFSAENLEDRTQVHYRSLQRPSWLIRLLLLQPGDFFHNDWVTRFDPVRTGFTMRWTNPAGKRRPFTYHFAIFMVPETPKTTRFYVFSFLKCENPSFRVLMPVVCRAQGVLAWFEIRDDARFIPTVANTLYSMKGMRLSKYDKPLIHHRKLLERIYYGQAPSAAEQETEATVLPLAQSSGG